MALYDPRTSVQAVAAEGFAKLLLHGILADAGILEGLLQLAYHPGTAAEPRLRQCLAYFLPAYAFSRAEHQRALAAVALPFLRASCLQPAVDALSVAELAAQLAHLTDPAHLLGASPETPRDPCGAHDVIALEALWALVEHPTGPLARPLLGLLARLRLPMLHGATVKQLLYLTAQLVKRLAGEKALLAQAKKVLAALVELDDVETALPADDLARIKERLARSAGAARGASPLIVMPAAMARAKTSTRRAAAAAVDQHVLDDLDDILQ
jgi:hypothetical protein